MTYTVGFTEDAYDQLEAIEEYIAESANPNTASSFTWQIVRFANSLNVFPFRGQARDDVFPGLRTIGFKKRVLITFIPNEEQQTVTITGIYYGGQDWESRVLDSVRADDDPSPIDADGETQPNDRPID